jgi:hypothetical protein
MTLFFMLSVYRLKDRQDEDYEKWDDQTCTPADYTMLVRLD